MSETTFEVPSGLPDIVSIAIQLWGKPTRRTPDKVLFGNRGSKCVNPAPANTWADHEADLRGGYLDLYKLKFGKLPDPPGFPIPPGMAKELGNPVVWWDYHDAAGQAIARVARFHPPGGQEKTHRQFRREGDRWPAKMMGLKLPLYRLPELLRAPAGTTVCITEGEKHTDQIQAWGMLATTNAGGAKKFRSDHATVLTGFDCVIVPDNDEAGRAHADVVAAALRAAGCTSIRVVNLPNLPPKGDVIDWVKAGGTATEFAELVTKAPAYVSPDRVPDEENARPANDQMANATTPGPIAVAVAKMNAQYMVVNEAGRAIIYQPTYDVATNRRQYTRVTFDDLRRLYLNDLVRIPDGKRGSKVLGSVADVWLHHEDRRQFIGGVIFDPSGRHGSPDVLNLWQDFAVKPRPGSWARLQDHVRKIICAGDSNLYDWLMGWMARLVQRPGEQGEVAVVMRGIEGCGKGTLAKALLHILGQHGLAINNSKHLTGNFNGHLRDTVLLFAEEAFFAGNRAHVGVLKSLITEPTLTIEAKHQNAVQMPNYVHLMMASNEDWVVPAGPEARRYAVFDVLKDHANDTAYFLAIWGEMGNRGYEAMLYDLLNYDLTFFNHRNAPKTAGLQDQKKLSLGTSESWWLDVLHRGYVWKSKHGLEDHFGEWHDETTTDVLFASYSEYAKAKNERHPMSRETFGRFMVRMGAKACRPSKAVVGERIADVKINEYGDTRRKAELVTSARATGYNLGCLTAARKAFSDDTGLTTEWPPE